MTLNNAHTKHVVGENAEYLVFPELMKYPELGAAFAIRGAKGYHYEPSSPDVDYSGVLNELEIGADNLVMPFQAHTDVVAKYDGVSCDFKNTDGLITSRRGVALGTKVADCISLLLYDPVHHAIANIHSGWRGTLLKIVLNGLRKMKEEYNTNLADLVCVICPSIRWDHFEVDQDVYDEFLKAYSEIIDEVTNQKDDKYYIDTVRCNTWLLENAGVKAENIIDSGLCTVCHKDLINSYRGNIESEKHFRNLALIWLKD